MVEMTGIEPMTPCMRSKCSPKLSYTPFTGMVEIIGIEPMTSCLQSMRSPKLSYTPDKWWTW